MLQCCKAAFPDGFKATKNGKGKANKGYLQPNANGFTGARPTDKITMQQRASIIGKFINDMNWPYDPRTTKKNTKVEYLAEMWAHWCGPKSHTTDVQPTGGK